MKLDNLHCTNPYLSLPDGCYDPVMPSPLVKPHLVHTNVSVASLLDIDPAELIHEEFVDIVNGTQLLEGAEPFAMCYAGHQFGHYVPRLGDGRAINIGTINGLHLQLKGAGQTKYSRSGDGRAVLRSSIREYLMSEAMHGLGIGTSRALAIIGSAHKVYREVWERGAIVLRVSPSWIRFGTFEYFAHKKRYSELEALADYAIAESYPHLQDSEDRYLLFFTEVVERTARLMAAWMGVGFSHGVMNTDNMSIHGITIDYGPFAFLDDYDPNYICNHTDQEGRYSFGNQPAVAEWNLRALMLALSPLVRLERMEKVLSGYRRMYEAAYLGLMRAKLGLQREEAGDSELITHLQGMLKTLSVDYTLFFRTLSHYAGEHDPLLRLGLYHTPMQQWLESYDKRLEQEQTTVVLRQQQMQQTNPKYVLKNYMLQEAIEAAEQGDFSLVEVLFTLSQTPYDEHPDYGHWAGATPERYKNRKLSCSS